MKKEIRMNQNLSIFEQAGKDIPNGLPDNKVKTVIFLGFRDKRDIS